MSWESSHTQAVSVKLTTPLVSSRGEAWGCRKQVGPALVNVQLRSPMELAGRVLTMSATTQSPDPGLVAGIEEDGESSE